MPSSYTIHPDLDLIVMRYSGHVTLDDLRRAFAASVVDPDYRPGMMEIGNFPAAIDTDIGFTAVMTFADKVREAYARHPIPVRVSHYAPTEIAYGMARMYQTMMSDVENLDVGLFSTVGETLDYLGLNDPGMAERLGLHPHIASAARS